ncbi:Uncharacterised protein [Mycobacteroides abscessus subsp. abscessus]|jgi:hypothetical protein|uniref:lasso peptide biosynthesis protein n=1 Tax=Mycobacteroides abscessus TaxID=36809 RepID=UPI00092C7AC6|nr:lasso peptide biosynthesis protein [Mycobacteroides abscessus]SIH22350.1 Uncharacterised protein [Mycobacteroides abscessus subsp. abscessus]
MDLSKKTPAEIDATIHRLNKALVNIDAAAEYLRNQSRDERHQPAPDLAHASTLVARAARYMPLLDDCLEQLTPLHNEYVRRGGWGRVYRGLDRFGRVHTSRFCPTCEPQTRFTWLTTYSGHSQEAVVSALGALACEVCYPPGGPQLN